MFNLILPARSNEAVTRARQDARGLLTQSDAPSEQQVASTKQATEQASSTFNAAWLKLASARTMLGLIVVGLAPGLVLLVGTAADKGERWRWAGDLRYHAVAAAATALIWVLAALLLDPDKGGLVRLLIGKGNRLSTSKLQILLWTFAVSYAFLLFIVFFTWKGKTTGFDTLNPDYLFLLGGPFAAALLAQATAVVKANNGDLQQPEKPAPGTTDLVEDSSGNASVTDAQFLVFNLVALVYFFAALVRDAQTLPDLPDTLVGLTSVSALTYVGGKLTNANAPTIRSISIIEGTLDGKLHADDKIRILGTNFVANAAQPEVTVQTVVLFGTIEAIPKSVSATQIVAEVPDSLTTGQVQIRVRTGAGTMSDPYDDLEVT